MIGVDYLPVRNHGIAHPSLLITLVSFLLSMRFKDLCVTFFRLLRLASPPQPSFAQFSNEVAHGRDFGYFLVALFRSAQIAFILSE